MFLMRRPPDLSCGIRVQRRNAETNDEVWPSGKCEGRNKSGPDDRDVCQMTTLRRLAFIFQC
jgi:hypothetical protein